MEIPKSPFMDAVLKIFERIGETLPENLPAPIKAILVGGAAVHVLTQVRVSDDVEAVFSRRVLPPQNLIVTYTDETGRQRRLAYDYNYFSAIALMHENFEQDSIPLNAGVPGRLELYVLSPLDLAVSKLARFEEHDREDIQALAKRGMLDPDALERRANEALLDYVGSTQFVKYNIADAVKIVRQYTPI